MADKPGVTETTPPVVAQEQVEETPVETTTTETAPQETTQPAEKVTETVTQNLGLDERGVPWQNRALEYERKYKELSEKVEKLETTNQPKKYTIQELEAFALQNPEHRPWVEEEKAKVLREQIQNEVTSKLSTEAKAREAEVVKQQTFGEVLKQFPDLAIVDQTGRFMGWNMQNPMTHLLGRYYQDPDLASRPNGLLVAAKLAYADHAMSQMPTTQKKVQSLKSQVKKIQQQTFVEGGGKPAPTGANPVRKAVENFRTTGKSDDAKTAMGAILRAQGLIKE